ncbi:MAG: helix-turn-helix domain-containing protein [Hominilimicola sp.]
MMTKLEIADILKRIRKNSGMTQQQLADRMGKSQQIIGHWETGYSQPDMSTLFDLFDLYGISLDETFLNRKS